MNNKLLDLILVVLILVIFIGYFSFKEATFDDNKLMNQIDLIEKYARNEEWSKAIITSKDAKKYWESIRPLININFAEEEVSTVQRRLSDIIGGTEDKNLSSVLSNVIIMRDIWKNINKFVPEP